MRAARPYHIAGTLYGVTGVVTGAWGAHGLEASLPGVDPGPWETAVLYQLLHALLLLVIGVLIVRNDTRILRIAGWLVVAGVLLFSGSLYALTLGAPGWVGPVTPIGGTALIAGWLCLLVAAWRWQ